MNDLRLRQELNKVSARYRRLLLRTGVAACCLALAAAGAALLARRAGSTYALPAVLILFLVAVPVVILPMLMSALRAVRDPLWVARRIERKFPDLDARLLAALEQQETAGAKGLGFLQETVVLEALEHASRHRWEGLVSGAKLRTAQWAQWAMLLAFASALVALFVDARRHPGSGALRGILGQQQVESFELTVLPEDTEVERNSTLLVMARFNGRPPDDVRLLYRDATGQVLQMPMTRSLDDPLFAGRVASVQRDLTYAVRYGANQSRWYKVAVFDYPDLKQADAKLKFPEYTGLAEKVVEDTRSITAVEGTKATVTFRLNKPVKQAVLVQRDAKLQAAGASTAPAPSPVKLSVDRSDPSLYTASFHLEQSQSFRLQLVDEQGRANKQPAPELALNVTVNRPPDLKLEAPGRDVDVSALEELSVRAQVWDDFGVKRVGMSFGIAGRDTEEVILAEGVGGKEKKQVARLLPLEQLEARPDELLSYYLWVEDVGPDGAVRRTSGDMFFAEVRPFDQIFRQGQQPAEGEQQQQQGNQNGEQAEQLAELQKQIINATWKVVRRETTASTLSDKFAPDVKTIGESQASAKEQAEAFAEKLRDEKSKAHLKNVLKHMTQAATQLDRAATEIAAAPLPGALSSEQAAYQELLKLRARETEVVRGSRRQRQQRGSQSASANRRQQQLDQLELDQEENRYETQRSAAQQQEEGPQRETRQVLNRLRELARRQEDLNRQMRELQSALQQAKEETQREEIKRQLARLRDQQQQMLRDTDELRDRMDQPENQQRMAEARDQLEQTREDVRRASEALEQEKVSQAEASGARAGEQLKNLRDEFRKNAAGQFNDAMTRMREEARQLDQDQKDLAQRLADASKVEQRSLRGSSDRKEVVEGLKEQKQDLEKLLEDMRNTVEESEQAEPLLSKQLYDTVRETRQEQPDQQLELSRQLLERGFVEEARQAETDAGRGITKLREGVEKAAQSVLGDETEALRRARGELDQLASELEQELQQNGRGGLGTTRPATRPGGRDAVARGGPTTHGAGERDGERQPEDRQPDDDQENGRQPAENSLDGQQVARADGEQPGSEQRPGQRSQRPGQERGQQPGPQGQGPQQQGPGQQPGEGQPPGEAQGQEQGQNPGQGQGQGQPQGQRGGQRSADAQARAGGLRGGTQRNGERRNDSDGQRGEREPGERDPGDLGQLVPGGDRPSGDDRGGVASGPAGNERFRGPLTGEGFRDWSDRLRDVEEMVNDPRLRAEAARIRDRARAMRADLNRHSLAPNWDMVRDSIGRPLVELRDAVAQELLRRQSKEALVPIDREPVPPQYADEVRRYYERLGAGK